MKISSSNIGTLAQPQAAKNYYPYQWAWSAIGDTFGDGNAIHPVNSPTLAAVSDGIQLTSQNSFFVGNPGYVEIWDGRSITASGSLNVQDRLKAKYLHGIFDFTGSPNINLTSIGTGAAGNEVGICYWYVDDTTTLGGGCAPVTSYQMSNGKTVIVNDMTIESSAQASDTWTNTANEAPIRLLYSFPRNMFNNTAPADYYTLCGIVLSDRILYDIPLPIRTHVG